MSTHVRFYLLYDITNTLESHFCLKNVMFVIMCATFPKICKPLVVYQFYCMALFHSQMRRHMINDYRENIKENIYQKPLPDLKLIELLKKRSEKCNLLKSSAAYFC